MRKEYDFSKGERGKFYEKVDTKNVIIENDEDESINEVLNDELAFLESNIARIESLKLRFKELDEETKEKTSQRISNAGKILDKLSLPE